MTLDDSAFVITLMDSKSSVAQAEHCRKSVTFDRKNKFHVQMFNAVTPEEVVHLFQDHGLKWSYPWTTEHLDLATGLRLTPYETADPKKRMACFMSHYLLWLKCIEEDKNHMILEHDAEFISEVPIEMLDECGFGVISLNDPRGATRRAGNYHDAIIGDKIVEAPWIDDRQVPQGLPGNSAYYLKPKGARKLVSLVKEYGAWPNDAIMCKQLMPRMLGCLGNYSTQVRKTFESSTTK